MASCRSMRGKCLMLSYCVKRLALLVFVLFGVTVITFLLMQVIPGDKALLVAINKYGSYDFSEQELAVLRNDIGVNLSLCRQYFWWLDHVVQGDFGYSFVSGRPVANEILVRLPATFELAVTGFLFTVAVAFPLGIITPRHPYSLFDNLTMMGTMTITSVPNFWLALLLILVFSLRLDLLPVAGSGTLAHMVLPAVTLGSGMAAVTTRLVRVSMLEVLANDYIAMARSKGLTEQAVLWRHALPNALIPVVTVLGYQFSHLIGGTVITETIFAFPGVGKLIVDSILARDIPVLQGCVLFLAVTYSIVNLLVDISYTFLDPRIRYKGGKD